MNKAKKLLLGTIMVGGLASGVAGCSKDDDKTNDDKKAKTEIKTSKPKQDTYGNIKLFEKSSSDIKFALAFVENYYPYVYWCGKSWTTGHGLTILYNDDGTYKKVNQNTVVPTLAESDAYQDNYLTFEVLPDIQDCITVSMNENTLIAACVLRYCIGSKNFRASKFVEHLNNGETGAKLAKTLTGWRQQAGVPNRCYFFAALMAGKIKYTDLLDLTAEGCYLLTNQDMFVMDNGKPKCDADGFYEWDFSNMDAKLEKARGPRTVSLNLGKGKRVSVKCKKTKDVVPDYVWQDVQDNIARKKRQKTLKTIGLFALGAAAVTATAKARKRRKKRRNIAASTTKRQR